MITQLTYDEFKENSDELISQYRENFSVPIFTDWKEYEYLYRSRLKGIATELRAMVDTISSSIEVEEAGRPSLLNARENVFIILVKEIFPSSKCKSRFIFPHFRRLRIPQNRRFKIPHLPSQDGGGLCTVMRCG